jgi:hypothetical protein
MCLSREGEGDSRTGRPTQHGRQGSAAARPARRQEPKTISCVGGGEGKGSTRWQGEVSSRRQGSEVALVAGTHLPHLTPYNSLVS